MPLSTNSLHRPLSRFFLTQFGTPEGSPVLFRFDRFGSVLCDADCREGSRPGRYQAERSREWLSGLVNRIPVDAGDGVHVTLSAGAIDRLYAERLLSPARPVLPAGVDGATRDAVISGFGTLKGHARRLWDGLTLESRFAPGREFRPVEATPAHWCDPRRDDVWAPVSFDIEDEGPADGDVEDSLGDGGGGDGGLGDGGGGDGGLGDGGGGDGDLGDGGMAGEVRSSSAGSVRWLLQPGSAQRARIRPGWDPAAGLDRQLARLDLSRRLAFRRDLAEQTRTQIVGASRVTVAFDYCIVSLRRDWYLESFVNDRSWWLPNTAKGELTAAGRPGSLPLLPVGLVVVRNLNLTADWSAADRARAGTAISFGPFDIGVDPASGVVSRSGLQVGGWLLQLMPTLPPNPPNTTNRAAG